MMHHTTGFTLPEAHALVGRAVRAKRKGGWQIEDGVVLEHHHTGTVIGVDGTCTDPHPDVPPYIRVAIQMSSPPGRRRKKPRYFALKLNGKVVTRIPFEWENDPLPFVALVDKPKFEEYFSLTS